MAVTMADITKLRKMSGAGAQCSRMALFMTSATSGATMVVAALSR